MNDEELTLIASTKSDTTDSISEKTLKEKLFKNYKQVRAFSEKLCEPLETEDYVIQTMPDVSPTKWHLAHTSWFFEAFILSKATENYKSINPLYAYLFNSYYIQMGERWYRPNRGILSRPTVKEIFEYRKHVDNHMLHLIENCNEKTFVEFAPVIEIGLNHEQQHQELLLTDIKHVLSHNPLRPVYSHKTKENNSLIQKINWIEFEGGISEIGYTGNSFAYDNETPKHKEFLNPFKIANRLVTNEEYIEFIEDGGYEDAIHWLSDGWATVEQEKWKTPLYWEKKDGKWWNFTLNGFGEVRFDDPVCHVSLYEADAFASWKDARLPTEAEWEVAAADLPYLGNFVESENFHPVSLKNGNEEELNQMYGDVWEWTRSAYSPYPGYKPLPGALGEYNGKFMSSQMVLRGGSCATSQTHIRKTYRNFFPPHSRWQFMGIRLAKDV
ncbi:ergothioneine biosynthesis protein EgtB [bacterium BMS3Abin03]|nr:ergothioneine biosynthesis protein EgtB [bacterium BMS3Abin03]MCG6959074.1 ergothioneine biosynthesis protein EgtB [bacterium BMS3Abin03]